MRLIDVNKLLMALNEWWKKTHHCEGFASHFFFVFRKLISEQPTIEIPQWIPCSERLPEENEFYLITFKSGLVEYLFFDNEKKDWYFVADGSEEDNTSWRELVKEVIAWQPLPEPYKGEEL